MDKFNYLAQSNFSSVRLLIQFFFHSMRKASLCYCTVYCFGGIDVIGMPNLFNLPDVKTFVKFSSNLMVLLFFCFRMSRRVSTRKRRPPSTINAEIQLARHQRRVQLPADPLLGPTSNIDDLVDKVAHAVLSKLQEQNVFNHNTDNQDLLLSATPAVQWSVVPKANNSVINHTESSANIAACVRDSDQATTTAAMVQGSVAAVLDGLSGATSVVTKPKDIFVSTNIPIDMNVSDRLQRKIWSHEYVDFRLLMSNKKEHTSFHFCLSRFQ